MSTQLGSRTIASPLLPCFETLFRSPIASSSRSRTRSTSTLLGSRQALRPSLSRGYAQPASKPVEDEGPSSQVDGDASASSSRSQDGSTGKSEPSRRRGGLSDEEKAKWAFPSKINPTPYDVLHLPKTASKADIKRHYYRLAMLYHPDANHPSASTDNFMALRNAYNLLKEESSRSTYNRTGVGWNAGGSGSSSSSSGSGMNWNDEVMREQIRRRAYGPHRSSSSSWGSGRGEGGYSQARWGGQAGDSDYGFAGYAHAGQDTGNRGGNYTSNTRFIGSVAILSVLFAMFQYDRASKSAESHRQQLKLNHLKASEALAEARHDARLYGAERRDRIRRYVRSLEVEREYERLMLENEGEMEGEGDEITDLRSRRRPEREKEDASGILHGR